MHIHGNKVVYRQEQLINIAKVEIKPQLEAQISEDLRTLRYGWRGGAKRRERRRKFKLSLTLILIGNVRSLSNKMD